jgi:hypothetical protein
VQELDNLCLRLTDAIATNGLVPAGGLVEALQLQGRLADSGPQAALAQDTITLAFEFKLKLHFGLCLTQPYHIIKVFGTRFPPQSPGNGVEQGRFAMAVVARHTGSGNLRKVEWRHLFPITHKVMQAQTQGDHVRNAF